MPTRAHLHRLSNVWLGNPLYFITQCTAGRRKILADNEVAAFIRETLLEADAVHGWVAGRFVIMPDHVHFFARPRPGAKELSIFMRDWKRWTARSILDAKNLPAPLWQAEFFDHVLRSAASYAEKWEYVRLNPVRAGLSVRPEDWPHAGECESLTF